MIVGAGDYRYERVDGWAKGRTLGIASGVATDSEDRVYVIDREPNPVVVIFGPDGTYTTSWGEGVLTVPHDIWIDAEDRVYIADSGDHTVRIFDKDGYLKITDRKKSLIITSGGKNIAPAPLENALLTSQYIDQVLVVGNARNFLTCLLVPSFENVKDYLLNNDKELISNEAIIDYPDVLKLFKKELTDAMKEFSKFEQIKKFSLLSRQFLIEKGELTPKMSIVRKKVEENFSDKIDEMYKGANL